MRDSSDLRERESMPSDTNAYFANFEIRVFVVTVKINATFTHVGGMRIIPRRDLLLNRRKKNPYDEEFLSNKQKAFQGQKL